MTLMFPHSRASKNPRAIQTQLDRFCDIYNTQRPHRAIGRKTPASVYATTPKTGPADRPLGTPTSIHRVTVNNGICHINKQYSISIGAAHNDQHATIIITGLACHIFIKGRLIRHLELDPTRSTIDQEDHEACPATTQCRIWRWGPREAVWGRLRRSH